MRTVKVWTTLLAIALLFVLAVPALAEQGEHQATYGTVKSASADQQKLVVTDKDGKDWAYHVPRDAKVILPDQSWTNASVTDLKAKEDVALIWNRTEDNALQALAIVVRSGRFRDAGMAWANIKSTDANDNTIKATDSTGKEWTFHLAKGEHLRMNDKQSALTDLKADQRVIIVYDKQGNDFRVLAVATPPTEANRGK
jgi:hypothetical protein